MRNKEKLCISDEIKTAHKVIKAVERKLPEEILQYCCVGFYEKYPFGYRIKFQYQHDDSIIKDVVVSFRISSYDGWVWFNETTWFKKEDHRHEDKSYHKEFRYENNMNLGWQKRERLVFKEVVSYIVDNISKYFLSNSENFINGI